MPIDATAYFLDAPATPLARRGLDLPDPGSDEAIVEVLACGLCHTDLGFADGSVPPRHPLPLVLGHEVVGTVVAAGGAARPLAGRRVLVPAVLPCGQCAFCRAGRANACPSQKMPGNDIHGGFATHLLVPAGPLVPLDALPPSVDARDLAVVADAVSTAYQAVRRAGLASGDLAVVVGAGGVGGFVVQIARTLGARVVACDIRPEPLAAIARHGADRTVLARDRAPKDVRREIGDLVKVWNIPSLGHRIFECSGSPGGQLLAFSLLGRAATLLQVGYTPQAVELRFSNLMAFDATVHGTWGAAPEVYPDVLRLVAAGQVALAPFTEHAPMSRLDSLLDDMAHHRLTKRMVLDPRA